MSQGDPTEIVTPSLEDMRRLGISAQATETAVRAIANDRNAEATNVLQLLARAVIGAVQQVDQQHDVSRFVSSVCVVCLERGLFNLEIADKNSSLDAQQLAASIADGLQPARRESGREQRIIQLEIKTT